MAPLLSIIVPCHNSARFIRETVASVRRQSRSDWELILIDDGSSDGTWEMISELAAEDPRIRTHRSANEGTCRARNRGFELSNRNSTYLFFLDHDDQVRTDFAETMCQYLNAHPEVGLLACQFEDISEEGKRLGTGHVVRWRPGPICSHKMRDAELETPFATFFFCTGRGPFAVYRRSVYERTSGWEVTFWPDEDSDMFCQMALEAKVHFLPERLYLKRLHPLQASRDMKLLDAGAAGFRAKWDRMRLADATRQDVLTRARDFYYRRHLPYLNLITAAQAVRGFLRGEKAREAGARFWRNLAMAARGFVGGGPA